MADDRTGMIDTLNALRAQVEALEAHRPDDPLSPFIGEVVVSRADVFAVITNAAAQSAASPLPSGAWETAALLKDRTRRVIRERAKAGESHASIAAEYAVPEAFVAALTAWQLGSADPDLNPPSPLPPAPPQEPQ